MHIDMYLEKHGMTAKDFALSIEYAPTYLRKFLRGEQAISKKLAFLIASFTNGEVTQEELLDYQAYVNEKKILELQKKKEYFDNLKKLKYAKSQEI